MKNICNIFLADWKRISKNVVAVVKNRDMIHADQWIVTRP